MLGLRPGSEPEKPWATKVELANLTTWPWGRPQQGLSNCPSIRKAAQEEMNFMRVEVWQQRQAGTWWGDQMPDGDGGLDHL